jgi:hypothetical protein
MRNEVTDLSAAKLKPCSPSNAILQTPVKRRTAIKKPRGLAKTRSSRKESLGNPNSSGVPTENRA